jgi:hypothetical protein
MVLIDSGRGAVSRCMAVWIAVFGLVVAYLTVTNKFYPEAELRVTGRSTAPVAVEYLYDLGGGFLPFQKDTVNATPEEASKVFQARVTLPYEFVKSVRVSLPESVATDESLSFEFFSAGKTVKLPAARIPESSIWTTDLQSIRVSAFSWMLLILQVLFAFVVTGAAFLVSRIPVLFGVTSWAAARHPLFVADGRILFWVMTVVAVLVHSVWLVAYWPATMTNDSWIVLSEIESLKISDWHPYPYTLFVMMLRQLFHSLSAVVFFQVVTTAALVSAILYFVWRRGVPLLVVLAFFALFVCSIPVGLYNTVIWKDVPFSIGILGLSYLLFRVQLSREKDGSFFQFSWAHWPVLGVLFLAICHFRHNGMIFYPLIPILFFGRVSWPDYRKLLGTLAVVFLVFNYGFPALLGIRRTSASPQQEYRTALAIMTHHNYYSKDRKNDQRIMEEATKLSWEKITSLYPRNWFDAWDLSDIQKRQFLEGSGHTEEYNQKFIARLVLTNLPIFLSSRTWEFFHSIGIDQSKYDETTDFYQNPLQLHGTNLAPPGSYRFKVAVESHAPSLWLRERMEQLGQWSMVYDGLSSRQVVIWNLLIYFGIFTFILIFERGLSSIGLFTLPSMLSAGAVFASGAGESWRYFYYVYLTGIMVIPLYWCFLLERRASKS